MSFSFEPSDIVSQVMSFGSPTPIEVAVSGPNLGDDREFATRVRERLAKIPALRDVQFGQSLDYPTLERHRSTASARGCMGVEMADVVALARRGHVVEPLRACRTIGPIRTAASRIRSRCRSRRPR